MAIDDNTQYSLSGAQVKDLASKIKAAEGEATLFYFGGVTSWTVPTSVPLFKDKELTQAIGKADFMGAAKTGQIILVSVNVESGPPAEYYNWQYLPVAFCEDDSMYESLGVIHFYAFLYDKLYEFDWDNTTDPVLTAVLSIPSVVQTAGTSTTDVMSQDGVSKLLFGKYNNNYDKERIQIGSGSYSTAGNSTAIGHNAYSTSGSGIAIGYEARDAQSSVGLGAFSQPSSRGEVNIGIPRATSTQIASYGHNNTPYRLLTGVSDPESAHDAATKGYVDTKASSTVQTNAGAPTTSTVGTVGQLLEDTTNGDLYICTAVTPQGTTPETYTYTWEEVGSGGGSGPTVVQTTGTSTTDVISQDGVSKLLFGQRNGNYDNHLIKIGSYSGLVGYDSIVIGSGIGVTDNGNYTWSTAVGCGTKIKTDVASAFGYKAEATKAGSIAVGPYSSATTVGEMNIGSTNTTYGYNSTNYRLLTGVHDPVNAHDAATKGYVDAHAGGGGLVTLSYGSSTWQDFLDAYNAGEIVYCRASSAADPSSGDQTRMAFMAYVNNPTTPTEVEFQYVRSVSTKSAAQPCDQVFVYKLTSANGGTWTVESRNVTYKVAAGTNVTTSYSNGTVTINADAPVITMTSTDPGEGGALAANNFIAVYNAS